MEEFRMMVITWCGILFMVCISFLVFIKIWEKRHPKALTPKGSQKEKQQYNQIITVCMNIVLSFVLLFLLAITNIGHEEPKPIMIYIFVGLGLVFVITNLISSFRKK